MDVEAIRQEFETLGRVWFRGCLSENSLCQLDGAASLADKPGARLDPSAPLRKALSADQGFRRVMQAFGEDLFLARIVAFNKTAGANWAVPWHQDRVIAVAERHDVPGFSNWSCKAGGLALRTPGRRVGPDGLPASSP